MIIVGIKFYFHFIYFPFLLQHFLYHQVSFDVFERQTEILRLPKVIQFVQVNRPVFVLAVQGRPLKGIMNFQPFKRYALLKYLIIHSYNIYNIPYKTLFLRTQEIVVLRPIMILYMGIFVELIHCRIQADTPRYLKLIKY